MIKYERKNMVLTFTTSATTAVTTDPSEMRYNGGLEAIMFDMPTFASLSGSGTLFLNDPDGQPIWTSTGNAYQQGTSTWILLDVPVVGFETIEMTLSAIPSGAGTDISVSATAHMYINESG